MKMLSQGDYVSSRFIPYVKYLLAPDTRFERDHEVFFSPKGKVAKGQLLINYGWGHGGLKEFVKAYYMDSGKDPNQFESYYGNLKAHRSNLLDKLESDKVLKQPLRGLITAKIHEHVFIPILVVDFTSIRFKYCENCLRRWEGRVVPDRVEHNLGTDTFSQHIRRMRCTRMACNHLCGNYKNCVLNYTSAEEDPTSEEKIIQCLSALIMLLREGTEPPKAFECRRIEPFDDKPKPIGPLRQDSKCFERPVRFDFKPIRRRHIDPVTWEKIQDQRADHGAHHIIDLIPSNLLPDVFEEQVRRIDVNAPLEAEGVLESFVKMANIKFEIKLDLCCQCRICSKQHCLSRVPISAMFKTDLAYIQEAGFGRMLWKLLCDEFADEMCRIYSKDYGVTDSPVLKREMKVSSLGKDGSGLEYDYAVDLKPLIGDEGWLLFDLTTGLWKKGGLHETTIKPQEYVERWKEMLFRIPSNCENSRSMWYIVIPTTEEQFFDESAPPGIDSMSALLNAIGEYNGIFNPLVIFNSTPRKGEARVELQNLALERRFQQTKVYPALQRMLREVK
jgi:hypothetical protein